MEKTQRAEKMTKGDVQEQIAELQKRMQAKVIQANKDCVKFVTMSSAEIERTAKTIMRDSPTNPEVSYGKHHHHPSYGGNPPAPDTGTLLQSVTHSVDEKNGEAVGYVGSVLKNPDYPRFLEYGTSKMKPRPWLIASITRCQSFMSNLFKEIFGK